MINASRSVVTLIISARFNLVAISLAKLLIEDIFLEKFVVRRRVHIVVICDFVMRYI